jgi:peptidoglycan/xylan/chitin deacetylase (PgdA/CDA1 family)
MSHARRAFLAFLLAGVALAATRCAPPPDLTGRGAATTPSRRLAEPEAATLAPPAPEEREAATLAPPAPEEREAAEPPGLAGLGARFRDGLLITGSTRHRIIHFTFDDGPDPRYTPALLDELDRAGVKATFFFSASRFHGRSARSRQTMELAREVLRRGHHVGSHSALHARMSRMNRAQIVQQLDESERGFQSVFGARTYLFRPPFGSRSARVDRLLGERGYTQVQWNIGLADWVERPPEEILQTWKKVLKKNERKAEERGGVVLMHDTDPRSAGAFRLIVEDIRQRNCELLARGEELFDIVDDLELFHLPRGEEPPGTHAPPAPVDEKLFAERQAKLRERLAASCPPPAGRKDADPAPPAPPTPPARAPIPSRPDAAPPP